MSNPNWNQNPDSNQSENPDNLSYTNLMLFGTPNAPGSQSSTPNTRPNISPYGMYLPYGMYPPHFDYNQQPNFPFPNPYFQQQPNFPPQQQPFQAPPQMPEELVSQRSGKQHASSSTKRSHKKKAAGSQKSCSKRQWAPKELAWLATCWCDTSEDSSVGNSQKKGTLWGTVEEKFNSNTHGWVRGADQLSSKWRVINNTCKAFNAIFESQVRAWGSGRDEVMVYDQAVAEYYDTYLKTFTMKEAWLAVKDHPKWRAPPSVGGTGLRDEDDDIFSPPVDLSADHHPSEPNELFGPDPLQRPMGRNRARKAARSSGSSDAATSSRTSSQNEKVDEAIESMARYKAEMLAARKASIEAITRQERLRTAMQGVQFLQINTADISDPSDRAAVAKMKKKFRSEFREFYESEDEDADNDE